MTIQLNGNSHEISAALTVSELLESIGYSGKPCVVELDEEAVLPRDFPHTGVGEGCRVEVVTLAAGG